MFPESLEMSDLLNVDGDLDLNTLTGDHGSIFCPFFTSVIHNLRWPSGLAVVSYPSARLAYEWNPQYGYAR